MKPSVILSLTAIAALAGVVAFVYHRRAQREAEPIEPWERAIAAEVGAVEAQIPGAWDRKGPKPGWSIWLQDTEATSQDLKKACGMTRLVAVLLTGKGVTDDWLAAMSGHPYVASVRLFETSVTDQGLARLKTLPALRFVTLKDTVVTPQGMAALKAALPRCDVDQLQGK